MLLLLWKQSSFLCPFSFFVGILLSAEGGDAVCCFLEIMTILQLCWSWCKYREASLVAVFVWESLGCTLRMCFVFSVRTSILILRHYSLPLLHLPGNGVAKKKATMSQRLKNNQGKKPECCCVQASLSYIGALLHNSYGLFPPENAVLFQDLLFCIHFYSLVQ